MVQSTGSWTHRRPQKAGKQCGQAASPSHSSLSLTHTDIHTLSHLEGLSVSNPLELHVFALQASHQALWEHINSIERSRVETAARSTKSLLPVSCSWDCLATHFSSYIWPSILYLFLYTHAISCCLCITGCTDVIYYIIQYSWLKSLQLYRVLAHSRLSWLTGTAEWNKAIINVISNPVLHLTWQVIISAVKNVLYGI